MQIECIAPFGFSLVGDVLEVPDGVTFSEMYFRKVEPKPLAGIKAGPPGEDQTGPVKAKAKASAKDTKKEEG